jgi:chromosome segregation ATPase
MDVATFVELVGSLGLPVALVIAMAVFIYKLWRQSAQRETKLYEELSACREVNKKAIETIAHYAEKLTAIQEDVKVIKEDMIVLTERMER